MKIPYLILLILLLSLSFSGYSQTAEEYFNSGWAKFKLEDYRGAIEDYNKSIEINPNSAITLNNRGLAKININDFIGAIIDCTKAIEINPNLVIAYNNRALTKNNIQDFYGAINDCNKAIEIDPNNAGSYINRGMAKINLQDNKGAIIDCTMAIEINPEIAEAYNNRGMAKINLQNVIDALTDFTKAIEINPMYAMAYNNRGLARMMMNQKESGCLDLNKAADLGYPSAAVAIKQYCSNITDSIRRYQVEKTIYAIHKSDVMTFLKDMPDAKEIQSYILGKDTLDIPINEVPDFLKVAPDAKPFLDYLNKYTTGWKKEHVFSEKNYRHLILYKYLIDSNRVTIDELGDFKTFNRLSSNPSDATNLYKNLIKKGFTEHELGTQSDFLSNITKKISSLKSNKDINSPQFPTKDKALTQTGRTDNLYSSYQIDKIKVGDTFIELPIPSGFVKVDDTMGTLLESVKKLCPKTNTILAYYLSDEDYATFLASQKSTFDKYIIIEVFNNFKDKQVGRKDYREFISSLKKQYIEEFKQTLNKEGLKTSNFLSNLDEKLKMDNLDLEPLGICYESENSISYGILSKYTFTIENESSTNYIVALMSTITKIDKKPIFLYSYKTYKSNEDINSLKAVNTAWAKEIDKKQSSTSFIADIDFEDYKESILAILTLSFIWAIYFATKKINKKINGKAVREQLKVEAKNNYFDFDELLKEVSTKSNNLVYNNKIEEEVMNVKEGEKLESTTFRKTGLLKVSLSIRFLNYLIDVIFLYFIAYCSNNILVFILGPSKANEIIDHSYIYGVSLAFIVYFFQELVFNKTLGKLITGTRVVDSNGNKPDIVQLIIRTVVRLIPFEALSFLGRKERGWHDTMSETFVIKG